MTRFLLVFVVLEVVSSGAAAWLFKAGRLPVGMRDFLCSHKLFTPAIVALVAPFAALAWSPFWLTLAAAIALSWVYVIFAVATAGTPMFKGSDGGTAYLITILWAPIASTAGAVAAVLVHLSGVLFR